VSNAGHLSASAAPPAAASLKSHHPKRRRHLVANALAMGPGRGIVRVVASKAQTFGAAHNAVPIPNQQVWRAVAATAVQLDV